MRRQGLCSTRWGRMESMMAGREQRPMGRRSSRRQIVGCLRGIGFGRSRPAPKRWKSTTRQWVRRFTNDGSNGIRTGRRRGIETTDVLARRSRNQNVLQKPTKATELKCLQKSKTFQDSSAKCTERRNTERLGLRVTIKIKIKRMGFGSPWLA